MELVKDTDRISSLEIDVDREVLDRQITDNLPIGSDMPPEDWEMINPIPPSTGSILDIYNPDKVLDYHKQAPGIEATDGAEGPEQYKDKNPYDTDDRASTGYLNTITGGVKYLVELFLPKKENPTPDYRPPDLKRNETDDTYNAKLGNPTSKKSGISRFYLGITEAVKDNAKYYQALQRGASDIKNILASVMKKAGSAYGYLSSYVAGNDNNNKVLATTKEMTAPIYDQRTLGKEQAPSTGFLSETKVIERESIGKDEPNVGEMFGGGQHVNLGLHDTTIGDKMPEHPQQALYRILYSRTKIFVQ